MKHITSYLLLLVLTWLVACSEQKSPLDNEARSAGTRAAAALMAVDHSDTIALQRAILDAKACQSVYVLKRDSLAVQAFDEAFRVYLQEYDAKLYQSIFPNSK